MLLLSERKLLTAIFVLIILCCACATMSGSTGLEKQSIETEYIEGDYKLIFLAIRDAFLNEGYSIVNSEIKSGLLLFKKAIQPTFAERVTLGRGKRNRELDAKLQRGIQVTVIIDDIGGESEIRSSFSGIDNSKVQEYALFLKKMYATVKKQVMIREGL